MQDFRRNFWGDPLVKIPWVRRDLSGPKVLVMEWIDGIRCTGGCKGLHCRVLHRGVRGAAPQGAAPGGARGTLQGAAPEGAALWGAATMGAGCLGSARQDV